MIDLFVFFNHLIQFFNTIEINFGWHSDKLKWIVIKKITYKKINLQCVEMDIKALYEKKILEFKKADWKNDNVNCEKKYEKQIIHEKLFQDKWVDKILQKIINGDWKKIKI